MHASQRKSSKRGNLSAQTNDFLQSNAGPSPESDEILGWLMEEKGWELKEQIDWWAGTSGSVEVFEFLRGRGYEFGRPACVGAAEGGRLEALKFLRGLDPPCPWDWTCTYAARQGQLDIVKWLRSQEPPCPWGEATSLFAAENGRLE